MSRKMIRGPQHAPYAARYPDVSIGTLRKMDQFHDDMIRRRGLPKDAFALIHDLAYDEESRDRETYRQRAQRILKAKDDKCFVREQAHSKRLYLRNQKRHRNDRRRSDR